MPSSSTFTSLIWNAEVNALATSSSVGGGSDWFGPELSEDSELLEPESSLLADLEDSELSPFDSESLLSVSAELSLTASGGSRFVSLSDEALSPAGGGS